MVATAGLVIELLLPASSSDRALRKVLFTLTLAELPLRSSMVSADIPAGVSPPETDVPEMDVPEAGAEAPEADMPEA